LGGPTTCKETVKLFKSVAERGPWMRDLAAAHRLYAEGNEMSALHLFAGLAAVGVESAQYNAAYILSKCTRCPPVNKAALLGVVTSSAGGARSASLESLYLNDPLERQHRSLKHSTATNFRALLKMHEVAEASSAQEATNGQKGISEALQPAGTKPAAPTRGVSYLPAAVWRDFLARYHPDSLVDALDLEFAPSGECCELLNTRSFSELLNCLKILTELASTQDRRRQTRPRRARRLRGWSSARHVP
jgi:hypothetical protein